MWLVKVDSCEVSKIISHHSKEIEYDNDDIEAKHYYKASKTNSKQIRTIIQTNKLIQVILAILINNNIPKINYRIACDLNDFIASDKMSGFQAVFNSFCLFYDKKSRFIHSINLGNIDPKVKKIFLDLKDSSKFDPSLKNFFNWEQDYQIDNLLHKYSNVYYELTIDYQDHWSARRIEDTIFNNAILQKLVVDVWNHGIASVPIMGWTLRQVVENESFLKLKQFFDRVFFYGVLHDQKWISTYVIVVSYSQRYTDYINNEIFTRMKI